MCLILLAWRAHPAFPLVLAANRDEAYDRPSAAAAFWPDAPQVYGGRDLDKGGTWLGVSTAGRIAVVTNFRDGRSSPRPDARSRGELTAGFLRGSEDPRDYLARIASRASEYNGFTLIVGDRERLWWYSNRGHGIGEIAPGVHALSNHLLDTPWPKVRQSRARLAAMLEENEDRLVAELSELLADRSPAPDEELPDTGVGLVRERELSCIFIAGERYGTRASTVLLVSRRNEALCVERRFGPRGAPLGETIRRFPLEPAAPAATKREPGRSAVNR
ncbi:MAG TPA: NRDE family protein [Burkholderiales bacterium]|nr:NRDE family protein [Burkholderiales bacterium]